MEGGCEGIINLYNKSMCLVSCAKADTQQPHSWSALPWYTYPVFSLNKLPNDLINGLQLTGQTTSWQWFKSGP